jgi:hypothetical protein
LPTRSLEEFKRNLTLVKLWLRGAVRICVSVRVIICNQPEL